MKVFVKVKPNSSQEKIKKIDSNNFEIWLKEKPIDNKANLKLEILFKKYFGKEVRIKSGFNSRKKVIDIS